VEKKFGEVAFSGEKQTAIDGGCKHRAIAGMAGQCV